ncbi:MAG: GntR family transcriptional regulator [Candidatus Wenzhouxiangella sp. M2_3B_020]
MAIVQTPQLTINVDSDVPIVQQIVAGLRRLLLAGALAPGDALPSSRALARDLGVHFNTVAQAYRELEAEGWLALKRRSGTVVRERPVPELDRASSRELAQRFAEETRDLRARYEALGLDRAALDAALKELIEERRNRP